MAASAAQTARKIVCKELGSNFRADTSIVPVPPLPTPLKRGTIAVRTTHVAVNASDVNFTAGKYTPDVQPPFDVGFEAMGEVTHAADDVQHLKPGDAVALTQFGAFSELLVAPAKAAVPLPRADPTLFPLFVSGLTASIALEKVGEMLPSGGGQTVLVTAAAGATGQIAVQLAVAAGHTVIGTCSSAAKAEHLRSLGVHRVVNYREEDLHTVLKGEFPKGVDIVYESVGGSMFDAAVRNLATHGRLIAGPATSRTPWPAMLLAKSASVRGFFLNDFADLWAEHMMRLWGMVEAGQLKPGVDPTPFRGLESVADAIDFMYDRKNVGKVVVQVAAPTSEASDAKL
ncbi:Zadh2 [Symbiodinium sp. KB8]|nr:Zadh2 [Symbiodinium sp. KB8]